MTRQRAPQKGNSGSARSTMVRQIGQRRERICFLAMMLIWMRASRAPARICPPYDNHIVLDEAGDQIVVVGVGYLAPIEAAGLGSVVSEIVDEDFAIDL